MEKAAVLYTFQRFVVCLTLPPLLWEIERML